MKQQATRNKPAFHEAHPILDAFIGALILATGVGGMMAMWIKVGAGL